MPFLNAAPFFAEAIESVRAQTYTAWELLLVDDRSTDGSTAIALDYAHQYPDEIRYLEHPHHQHRGASAARNLGIRHAQGKFLALLDADDVWLPHKLEEQVPLLEAHPQVGMLYGNTLFWHSWMADSNRPREDYVPALGVALDTISPAPDILTKCLTRRAAVPCTCSVLMRKEVVERVGGFEDSFQRVFTDQAFYAKMLTAAPVYVADRLWDKYRIHPDSSCSVVERAGGLRQARLAYLEWLVRYLREQGMAHRQLTRALAAETWLNRHPRMDDTLARVRGALNRIRSRVRAGTPEPVRQRIRRLARPPGGAGFGNMRRVVPLSRHFGYERGQPVDRHYIEAFLATHAGDIHGRVLEIGDDAYTRRFGGDRVRVRDVLHVHEGNPHATIVGDLASGERIPSDAFDCVILTQTLQLIFDVHAAVRTLHRILTPGGVLLATMPGITPLHAGRWKDTWFWSFTPASVRRLFGQRFPVADLQVNSYGNVLIASAFLYGLAREELLTTELAVNDSQYPVVVTLRARKAVIEPGAAS